MRSIFYSFLTVMIGLLPLMVFAGSLDSPAGPTNSASAMYTIQDLYDYLDTGVSDAKRTGGFTEPVSGPGPTGRTLDEVHAKISEKCITCGSGGTLNGTRWCDQGNGTVKDMTTGLVWLKDAAWGGQYAFWEISITGPNAHDRAAQLKDGDGGLSDGSGEGDWRLPTKTELYNLANGTEAVRNDTMRAFFGVATQYWSSTASVSTPANAWNVLLDTGAESTSLKNTQLHAWPVRSGN